MSQPLSRMSGFGLTTHFVHNAAILCFCAFSPFLVGDFRAWVARVVFQAKSERIPSSEPIRGKFRANSGQFRASIPNTRFPCHSMQRNLLGWLTTRNTLALG